MAVGFEEALRLADIQLYGPPAPSRMLSQLRSPWDYQPLRRFSQTQICALVAAAGKSFVPPSKHTLFVLHSTAAAICHCLTEACHYTTIQIVTCPQPESVVSG